MTVPQATARTWATGIEPGSGVAWRGLEVAAFDAYPDVLEQLDPSGRYDGGQKRRGRMRRKALWWAPAGLLMGVLLGSPIWGFATLASGYWRGSSGTTPDSALRIPAAGVIFAVSLAVLLSMVAWWFHNGRRGTFVRGEAWLVFWLGGLSATGAAMKGPDHAVPNWGLWTTVMATATAAGAVVGVAHHFLHRPQPESTEDVEPLKHVRRVIERLAPAERQAVSDDLSGALRDLAERRVLTPAEAEWAFGAEPGKLALHMSQRRSTRSAG